MFYVRLSWVSILDLISSCKQKWIFSHWQLRSQWFLSRGTTKSFIGAINFWQSFRQLNLILWSEATYRSLESQRHKYSRHLNRLREITGRFGDSMCLRFKATSSFTTRRLQKEFCQVKNISTNLLNMISSKIGWTTVSTWLRMVWWYSISKDNYFQVF